MLESEQIQEDPFLESLVDERYRVLERVGQGGMGVVYRVEHVRIGKVAALKLLHRRLCSEPAILKRFKVEAEAISKLNHPNIVQVFDFGEVADAPYLVMEYLHGENLGAIIRRDGPLPLRRSVPVFVQICDALTEAHELGIVHRDLKPENIQVSRTRAGKAHVKVLDFGLAKIIDAGQTNAADSAAGNLVGTPYYMAPELIRGRTVDHRADIYAMGALIYRVITGKHAFHANSPVGVLTRHITEKPVPPSETAPDLGISSELDGVVARALAKEPAERFASVVEMKQALVGAANRAFSQEVDISAAPEHPTRRVSDSQELPMIDEEALAAVGADLTPPRLTRADLAFERKLRRNRVATLVALLALVAAGAALAYRFFIYAPAQRMPSAEIEGNNDTATATPLARDKAVTGTLGKRLNQSTPDRDWYRVEVPGSGVQALSAHVTGIPNIDLCLELYDHLGEKHLTIDSTGVAGHELLVRWPIQPGTYYLLVREVFEPKAGRVPTENVTDAYTLRAHSESLADEWEREPNDEPRSAREIAPGEHTKGHLARHDDRDHFKVTGIGGKLVVAVSAIPAVDILLDVLDDKGELLRRVDGGGLGKGEALSMVTKAQSVILRLQRKLRKKQAASVADRLTGVDSSYTLKVSAR